MKLRWVEPTRARSTTRGGEYEAVDEGNCYVCTVYRVKGGWRIADDGGVRYDGVRFATLAEAQAFVERELGADDWGDDDWEDDPC